jgi:hypothetical protein
MTNSTIALNMVSAAASVQGGSSSADGGGVYSPFSLSSVTNSTIAGNVVSATGGSANGEAGGIDATNSGFHLEATILANNVAAAGPDCVGNPLSDGHNLVRKLTGCTIMLKPSDIVGKDPKLGTLASNGGPTRTMAIAPTSPALDAIPAAACALAADQRGVHRPQGTRCDIGAYERTVT